VSKSYEDATWALRTANNSSDHLKVNYYNGSGNNSVVELYMDKQDKDYIFKKTINGDTDAVFSFFAKYYEELFERNLLTSRVLAYVCFTLTNILIDAIDTIELHNNVTDEYIVQCQQTLANRNYTSSFLIIRDNFLALSRYIQKARNKKTDSSLRETMLSYVDENFTDPDISLKEMAADLHVSYNYLCRFFKEQTGVVFLDYLHNMRIEKSKELLRNTAKSINDIAAELGYTSANSFIRKFKSTLDMSPGEYRKLSSSDKH